MIAAAGSKENNCSPDDELRQASNYSQAGWTLCLITLSFMVAVSASFTSMGHKSSVAIRRLLRTRGAVILQHIVTMALLVSFTILNTAVLFWGSGKVCATGSHRLLSLSVIFSLRE